MRNTKIILILIIIVSVSIVFIDYGSFFNDVKFFVTKNGTEDFSKDMKINDVNYISNYFYYDNNLTDSQKNIYEYIAMGVQKIDNTIEIYNYTGNKENTISDVKRALECFLLDHPEVFYLESNFQVETKTVFNDPLVQVNLFYTVENKNHLNEYITYINKQISNIKKLNIGTNDFKIIEYIYDMLSKEVIYDPEEEINRKSHTVQGALIDKVAVCDGFAKSMQLFLSIYDIENITVVGSLNNVSHAWNMIKLNNNWYHLDVTSSQINNKYVSHAYFNMTKEQVLKTHDISNEYVIYKTPNTNIDYYENNKSYITRSDDLSNKLSQIITDQKSKGYLEFKADIVHSISEITKELYYLNYKNMKSTNSLKIEYIQILDTYIIMN